MSGPARRCKTRHKQDLFDEMQMQFSNILNWNSIFGVGSFFGGLKATDGESREEREEKKRRWGGAHSSLHDDNDDDDDYDDDGVMMTTISMITMITDRNILEGTIRWGVGVGGLHNLTWYSWGSCAHSPPVIPLSLSSS